MVNHTNNEHEQSVDSLCLKLALPPTASTMDTKKRNQISVLLSTVVENLH